MILAKEGVPVACNNLEPLRVGSTAHQFCVSRIKIPRSVMASLDIWRRAELEVLAEDGIVFIEEGA